MFDQAATISDCLPGLRDEALHQLPASGAIRQTTPGETTTYVDEAGNPVLFATVKSGPPVTVYYRFQRERGSTATRK
jgi:hypothetical protein